MFGKRVLLTITILCFVSACNNSQISENKEVELLRKENELAKKELELTKKELELSKADIVESANGNLRSSSTPVNTLTREEIKETDVRLRFVNDSRACNLIKGSVTLKTKGKTLTAVTGKKGFALFNNVPCGDVAIISVFDADTSYKSDKPVRQKISCSKSVYLGSFDIYYGNKVSEDRADYCYNLNPN